MKKTSIIPGACFGYFDEKFEDCGKCKIAANCLKATNSDKVEEVRSVPKIINSQVDALIDEWKPSEPTKLGGQNFEDNSHFPDGELEDAKDL